MSGIMSNDDPSEIIEFIKRKIIDIIGFASITDSIPLVTEDFSPQKPLESAQSIICFTSINVKLFTIAHQNSDLIGSFLSSTIIQLKG